MLPCVDLALDADASALHQDDAITTQVQASGSQVSQLRFLPSTSGHSDHLILLAVLQPDILQTWTLDKQNTSLCEAFSSLEGKKKDAPPPEDSGTGLQWVVKTDRTQHLADGSERNSATRARIVDLIVMPSGGLLVTSCGKEDGLRLHVLDA